MHINSVFMILNQLGVGPSEGFRIEDDIAVWNDYITEEDNLDAVKSYIHLKVKLLFDPPLSSAVMEANKQIINELEWRLNVEPNQINRGVNMKQNELYHHGVIGMKWGVRRYQNKDGSLTPAGKKSS